MADKSKATLGFEKQIWDGHACYGGTFRHQNIET